MEKRNDTCNTDTADKVICCAQLNVLTIIYKNTFRHELSQVESIVACFKKIFNYSKFLAFLHYNIMIRF